MNKADFKITKGQIKNGNNSTREIIPGHTVFSAATICASLQSRNASPVAVTSWDTRKDGRRCWRGKQGREMERKWGEAIEEEGKHEHGIYAHNQVSQIVNNWAVISETLL